jgi:hypothetical protein
MPAIHQVKNAGAVGVLQMASEYLVLGAMPVCPMQCTHSDVVGIDSHCDTFMIMTPMTAG